MMFISKCIFFFLQDGMLWLFTRYCGSNETIRIRSIGNSKWLWIKVSSK